MNLVDKSQKTPFINRAVLLIAAHPDDEVLFAGSQLSVCRKLWIVHVTDGAPSKAVARRHGFPTRKEYAKARRRELQAALEAGGIQAECRCLGYRDQYSCLDLFTLSRELAEIIKETSPDLILTHPYEGGHRDHDSVAFVVQSAAEITTSAPPVWEMACYHQHGGKYVKYEFPNYNDGINITLTPEEISNKIKMLNCFISQKNAINELFTNKESFRLAPLYEFRDPPIEGRLNYESSNFGFESAIWRLLALTTRQAFRSVSSSGWRIARMRPAMKLMIKTSRWRLLYPRFARPLERVLFMYSNMWAPRND